ncbi:unnamed protein product [Owenia fusiformis]|uniref:Uncharacterized protein n=1 Tax=Owenia fusiformis TaxID=6347 RepID=A0A8J1UG81_OWEFU|nr:unnamed protein product [Owenia fusiformis]
MASKKPVDVCCEWIADQKKSIHQSDYGSNSTGVKDAIVKQEHTDSNVKKYKSEINKAILTEDIKADSNNLETMYEILTNISSKKLDCLTVLQEVSGLEELCGNLGNQIDTKSVELASKYQKSDQLVTEKDEEKRTKTSGKDLSMAAQGCIYALKENWIWMTKLMGCLDVHVKNAAEYHQFFHDADEYETWLYGVYEDISGGMEHEKFKGTYQEAQQLLIEIQNILTSYRQWHHRSDHMFERARQVVPVDKRTTHIEAPEPIRALCHYKTSEISIREGEELLLIDNKDSQKWRVKNYLDREADVPALICLIPPPDGKAVELAIRLRLQLLAAWTNTIKRFGKKLIRFMLVVFRDWCDAEIEVLQSLEIKDREEIYRILALIEDTLSGNWSDYAGFVLLQEKLLSLKLVLEESGDEVNQDPSLVTSLVVQIKMLEKLMERYKELWGDWEKYKVVVETSKQPELMLICEKWQQLQFVSSAYFNKYWQTNIDVEKDKHRSEVTVEIEELQEELSPTVSSEYLSEQLITLDLQVNANDLNPKVTIVQQPEVNETTTTTTKTITTTTIEEQEMLDANKNKQKPQKKEEEEEEWSETTEELTKTTQIETTREWERKGTKIEKDVKKKAPKVELEWENKGTKIQHGDTSHGDGWSETGDYITKTTSYGLSSSANRTPNGVASSRTVEINRSPGYQQGSGGRSEVTVKSTTYSLDDTDHYPGDSRDYDESGETKNAHADEIMHASREEQKKFVIRSVVDPRNKDEISLQQAIMLGIIDPNKGLYVNPTTGETIPIPTAMNDGLISVEFQTVKRSREKMDKFGLITIKTKKEQPKSYTIKNVLDMKTEKELTPEQASRRGILNEDEHTFKDTASGKSMSLSEAIEQGCVAVEYGEPEGPPEYETKTYAVRAAVDQRLKKKIPFSMAVTRGVIDRDTGAYVNNVTHESMFAGDAIMRGFLKARLVDESESHSLDINPENKIVIEKVQSIKKKLFQPLKILRALKATGQIGHKK